VSIKLTRRVGTMPGFLVRFKNGSKRPVTIVRPQDGSFYGWVEPHYKFVIDRRGGGKAATMLPRCGNHGAVYNEHSMVSLEPGKSFELDVRVPVDLKPGAWHASLDYVMKKRPAGFLPAKAKALFIGKATSNTVSFSLPGPDWAAWLEEPREKVVERFVSELTRSGDAASVGAAVDALRRWDKKALEDSDRRLLSAALPKAMKLLLDGLKTWKETDATYVPGYPLPNAVHDLLNLKLVEKPEALRAQVRRFVRTHRKAAARPQMMAALARHADKADLHLFRAEIGSPGNAYAIAAALEGFGRVKGRRAAMAAAMETLARMVKGSEIGPYLQAVARFGGVYEPSYIKVGERGRRFAINDKEQLLVKQQWLDWWGKNRDSWPEDARKK
jgi:hypothetical protein